MFHEILQKHERLQIVLKITISTFIFQPLRPVHLKQAKLID